MTILSSRQFAEVIPQPDKRPLGVEANARDTTYVGGRIGSNPHSLSRQFAKVELPTVQGTRSRWTRSDPDEQSMLSIGN